MNAMMLRLAISFVLMSGFFFVSGQRLEENFKNPPTSAKPRTWMHVMSGNMSKVGMTKDLEAIADVGIGGIILFNVSHAIPKGQVLFNSPEHIEMIAHTATECERLGLSFGIHNCDGWTSSGGPWVTPENSMKQVVFNELIVQGGKKVNVVLPQPAAREGYYKDIAVVAYPSLPSELFDAEQKPIVTSSNPEFDTALATDGKADVKTILTATKERKAWVQFDFGKPHTIRSLYIDLEKAIAAKGKTSLLISSDGLNFEKARELEVLRLGKRENAFDDSFEDITARYFRVETETTFELMEISLSATTHINNMLARTSLYKIEDHRLPAIETPEASMIINKEKIINLTKALGSDGVLHTSLPKGQWTIMRFGYTVTGAVNSPASDEGRGLEVDKMSRPAFKTHYNAYVKNVINASKAVAPKAMQYIEIDSYEVGGQNWTGGYETFFKEKYGYDLIPFLPLYAGKYVECAETANDVLWDVRNFNSELIVKNYFDYFSELCHADGLISYVEPYSFNAPFNELDASRLVDVPMGEFWMHQRYQSGTAVSGARIYGKQIISAESFSAQSEINWSGHPGMMKLTGDKAWTLGINEFMFHRFTHQPNTHVKPGMTMSQWGSHIDRTQTWWYNAGKAWFTYLARGQYLLRQGIPVSDLLVFVGDGSPNSIVQRNYFTPSIPNHLNFDCINTDALINRITVKNHKPTLPNGIQYHALVLYNTKILSLETLKKIDELAQQGVIIIGEKPIEICGHIVTSDDKNVFEKLTNSIWNEFSTYSTFSWDQILKSNNIDTDLDIEGRDDITFIHRRTSQEDIYFFYNPDSVAHTFMCRFNVENKIPEVWNALNGETVMLAQFENQNGTTPAPIQLEALGSRFVVFRKSSKDINTISVASQDKKTTYRLTNANEVMMETSENGDFQTVFSDGKKEEVKVNDLPSPILINMPWKVTFPDMASDTKTFTFKNLMDWTNHPNDEVRHYSRTALYQVSFTLDKNIIKLDRRFELDLGAVSIAADVTVNEKNKGVLWTAPYKIDITDAIQEGVNTLSIEVTNVWTNRLIGDQRFEDKSGYAISNETMPDWYLNNQPLPQGPRTTFTTFHVYKKDDPLLPSGMVGPVRIIVGKQIKIR